MSVNPMEEKQFKEEPFLISATCMKLEKTDQQSRTIQFLGPLPKALFPS